MEDQPIITAEEVETLNAARVVLNKLDRRAVLRYGGTSGGRLAGYASAAEDVVFMVLNIADTYCDAGLTKAQLHEDVSAATYDS